MSDQPHTISRREFAALSLAVGATAAAGISGAAAAAVLDTDVQVRTPSGSCDAALVHPKRDMAKRLAADGYTVLVPNPYYRSTKPPGINPGFDFTNPADRAKLEALRAPLTTDAVMQDAIAYGKFLDSHSSVDKKAKMGVFGYCMGGPMTMQAAAAQPDRIGAGASFHGGGLVTDKPDRPHLLVPQMKAQYYFGIAENDDQRQPDAKTKLDEAFRAAHLPAKIEVYAGTLHGWCVKDMPLQNGKPIYNEAAAERAWSELVALFKRANV